jgi:hypothetical protein
MRRKRRISALACTLALLGWGAVVPASGGGADEPAPPGEKAAKGDDRATQTKWTTAVEPKPLSANVKKGLAWLAEHQLRGGGWGQGEESAEMGGGAGLKDVPDVADTCIAALALIRSGSTPREGPYKDALAKAVRYVRGQVEQSDSASMSVTRVQGMRVQQKLGPTIDTFLASLLLAEVKGKMPDDDGNRAVDLALTKVLDKIKRNQKGDGTWDNQTGWAPVLAQSLGGKGLNRAKQAGAPVSEMTLARAESFALSQARAQSAPPTAAATEPPSAEPATVARASTARLSGAARRPVMYGAMGGAGGMGGFAGSAGVELYGRSASLGVLQDSVNTNAARERDLRQRAESGKDEKERDEARRGLARIDEAKKAHREAQEALLARLDDKQFVAGFGSNGGEEFLSYMNISESLVVRGGLDWKRWDDAMASNLGRVQNQDGSWSGHHCITGRTFCTATALLVLMADRTPVPVQAKGEGKKAESKAVAK